MKNTPLLNSEIFFLQRFSVTDIIIKIYVNYKKKNKYPFDILIACKNLGQTMRAWF